MLSMISHAYFITANGRNLATLKKKKKIKTAFCKLPRAHTKTLKNNVRKLQK